MQQLPHLTNMIALIVTIVVLSVAFDKFLLSRRLNQWRKGVRNVWVKLNTPGSQGLIHDANNLFCDLFDAIYGKHTFSWRRITASVLSTLVGLVVLILVLGFENTIFQDALQDALNERYKIDWWKAGFVIVFPFVLNLIPDFFSLTETRFILETSKNHHLLGICGLLVLDLLLTSALFLVGFLCLPFVAFFYTHIYTMATSQPSYNMTLSEVVLRFPQEFFAAIFATDGFLVFYLTTFITSALWILFVFTFILILVLYRFRPFANFICYELGRSKRPVLVISGFWVSIMIIVYIAWIVLRSVI